MDDIERRAMALEILASEYEKAGRSFDSRLIRQGTPWEVGDYGVEPEIAAIIAALTPPEGYVLVPVEAQQEAKRFRWLRTCSREQYLLARGMFGLVDDAIDAVIQSEEAEAHNGK